MRHFFRPFRTLAATVLALSSAVSSLSLVNVGMLGVGMISVVTQTTGCTHELNSSQTPLASAFRSASKDTGVPEELLLAVGYVATRWHTPDDEEIVSHDEHLGRGERGLMGVVYRPNQPWLFEGSRAAGVSFDAAQHEGAANIRAAAFVLKDLAEKTLGRLPDSLDGWRPVLALYGADGDETTGDSYADEVLATLAIGATGLGDNDEELVLPPFGALSGMNIDDARQTLNLNNGQISFVAARYYTSGRTAPIDRIVIHTTEGSYQGAISWFRSPDNTYKTSAHYVIRSADGAITQMVREGDTAHHARSYNARSIGIEHEAISAQGQRWFTDAMYRSSAALVREICLRHNIPMDRAHIVGHNEVPGNDHSDPGRHWDWDRFMVLVKEGSETPSQQQPAQPAQPAQPSDPCRGETYLGRCSGETVVWCESNTVKQVDCASRGKVCGYQNDAIGYNCLTAPTPAPADPCQGESYLGRCDGNTVIWCENNQVRTIDCAANANNSTCGYQDSQIGYNCL